MFVSLARIFDPMVRLLILALVLAIVLPIPDNRQELGQWIANAAIFVLFFLNGLRLPRDQVLGGVKDWRFHGALALWVFGAMLFGGWVIWQFGTGLMPAMLALGFLYLGALPSTIQSATVYTSMAGGNVAHAVVAAAVLNILGVFITAPLFAVLAGGEAVAFHSDILIKIATVLLLPFALGQMLQPRFGQAISKNSNLTKWTDRIPIAIAVYVAMGAAVNDGVWARIDVISWLAALAAVMLYLFYAIAGSWGVGGMLTKNRKDRIAFLFAGTQKSLAMGAPLATLMFDPAVAGIVLIPLIAYHFIQLVVAAPIASRLNQSN